MSVTTREIQVVVAEFFHVRVDSLRGPCRTYTAVRARRVAMYLARELTGASYGAIGLRFNRDRRRVHESCVHLEEALEGDPAARMAVESLRGILCGDSHELTAEAT